MYRGASIHWHGLHQKNYSWADGPAFVNQCPIAPNHQFLYLWFANKQTGTYWYHSHYATQYCDGVRGPLVIYDPQDPHRQLWDVDNRR
jgi:iron transport multicopper oxidase